MFDRLLGPKTDHADPKVRAKAFAHDSLEAPALNDALQKEQDPEVLCVILRRATDVSAVLDKASSSTGSIANEARTRLVALAGSDSDAGAAHWQQVFATAYSQSWSQAAALNDVLTSAAGREHVIQGALGAQPDPALLEEPVLLRLATHSATSPVRRLAASKLVSDAMLEACCQQLKDKDKTVFKEVKLRLEGRRQAEERKARATQLAGDITKLGALSIIAQPESVAVAQARRQTLEERVAELVKEDAAVGAPVAEALTQALAPFDLALEKARAQATRRKELKNQLSDFDATLQQDAAPDDSAKSALGELKSAWDALPDHSDLDASQFEATYQDVSRQLGAALADGSIFTRMTSTIDQWESKADSGAPDKLLAQIEREWKSCEKPASESQLATLRERVTALTGSLQQKLQNLQRKRAANSEQMLKILGEFNTTMEAGEFKKAMSLNDKLKARAANRELEPEARKHIEDVLKKAQPKLEEFRKWRHFGTQQARENLIGQANTLISEPPASPKALSTAVKALRESWRKLDQDDGRASEPVWQTFSKACKEAYKPAKKHFDQLAKERKSNLTTKKAILEKLTLLLSETDWSAPVWQDVAKAHRDLQTEWQRSGTVDYKIKKELDADFERINGQFEEQFKDEREHELQRRRRLIDGLKEQQASDSGGKLAAAAKRAQRDWRPTVQSDRKTEQALWKEFRTVCDSIFDGLKVQQKEAKAAWQAEVSEREAWCAEVNGLLLPPKAGAESAPSSEHDANEQADDMNAQAQAASQAKGQLAELSKQWRTRHQIPSGIAAKLDGRFKQARQSAEKRIASVMKRQALLQERQMDVLLDVCQRADEAVLEASGAEGDASFASRVDEFSALKGAAGKALHKRFERAVAALGGDPQAAKAMRDEISDNLTKRLELVLVGELITHVESPADKEKDRMALKMKRLNQAMQGELDEPDKELSRLSEQWLTLGGVEAADWTELKARYERVQEARQK